MIVAEVEPLGGLVAEGISEPLLQTGILLSVLAYITHLDPWMALAAFAIFLPRLVFVPPLQRAIKQRNGAPVSRCCANSGSVSSTRPVNFNRKIPMSSSNNARSACPQRVGFP